MPNPLLELQQHGQAVWLDQLRRGLLTSGHISRLIETDGLRGVTSNPTIFEEAISGSRDYEGHLRALDGEDLSPQEVYEALAVQDIQWTADLLRPVWEELDGADGYVSLEASPHLAYDSEGTVAEVRRLHRAVGRPNVMIKVPGTPAGIPAVEQLIAEGYSINITLLFGQENYFRVAEAYMAGLERLIASGGDPARVASVASFFISRIDALADLRLEGKAASEASAVRRWALRALKGRVAVANARLAYARYEEMAGSQRWQLLVRQGARPQRLLWASTGTKDPAYRDVIYVEELIAPDTVNTMKPETMDAFRDHGRVADTLRVGVDEAGEVMAALQELGISMQELTDQLQEEGVAKFVRPFEQLLGSIQARRAEAGYGIPARRAP
ncbi:MAG: transaldolase [Candidatus Latescibacterota bacterium]